MSATWLGYLEPADVASIPRMSVDEVAAASPGELQLVDVRRSDLTAYMLAGSINLPAHSFYPSRHTLAKLLAGSGTLVFYCNSSNGRGPRCAGWMRDTLVEAGLADRVQVKILAGGAKAFIAKYQHDSQRVVKMPDEVTSS